ncbi:deoxyribodipyrimidine photo-lyase [soil metagenome]
MDDVNIFWFRRDIRLNDNAGLYRALTSGVPVLPVFIFDKNILDKLEEKKDRRVQFIRDVIVDIREKLEKIGVGFKIYHGSPEECFRELVKQYRIRTVVTNHDYEPYAIERDNRITALLKEKNIQFKTFKDQVIFDKDEILKDNGEPYTVFTPYSRKWKAKLNPFYLQSYPCNKYHKNFYQCAADPVPSLQSMGFKEKDQEIPSADIPDSKIKLYDKTRNFPGIKGGTTRIGIHLRFGTVSIREEVQKAIKLNTTFLNELIWREFYMSVLWHFPHVGHHKSFKPKYDNIKWRNSEQEFEAWCQGKTGYPIVDAGMRQLNSIGFMHNRVRMITGSFLCKHLLIDWRWGEAYFAEKLLDYDLAANNGGWQWVAGSGCDAAPYFRIFNPELQTKKFDEDLKYIKEWVPGFEEFTYPKPIVDHKLARERCLKIYKEGINSGREGY